MEKQVYKFTNEINELKVCTLSAKLKLTAHDEDFILAEYDNPAETPKFSATLTENKLIFKESKLFSLVMLKNPIDEYSLNVYLPRRLFKSIEICTASGGAEVSGVESEEFILNTASGKIDITGTFGDIKLKSASGNIVFANNPETTAKSLRISSASGDIEAASRAESFSISGVSGKITYTNACGKGSISMTSGNIDVNYADWNDDLSINVVSGKSNITLPAGSGAELSFNGVSGTLKTDIGGEKGKFMNIGKGTNGTFGSGNVHKITASTTSGCVTIAEG